MPIYEYRCTANDHQFEAIQKFSDPPPARCLHCDSPVEKLISRSSFHLKGSGWYVSDYRKSSGATSTASKPSTTDGAKCKSPSSDTGSPASTSGSAPKSGCCGGGACSH